MTDEQVKMVDQAVMRLSEEFDSVLILTSLGAPGTTILSRGAGNYFARLGMCHEFINQGKADILATEIQSRQ